MDSSMRSPRAFFDELLSSLSTGLQKLSFVLSTLLQLLFLVTVFIVVSTILIVEFGLQELRPKERLLSLARFLDSKLVVLEDKAFEALKGMFLLVFLDLPHVSFYIVALSISVLIFHSLEPFLLVLFIKCCFARTPEAASTDDGGDEGEGEANSEEISTPARRVTASTITNFKAVPANFSFQALESA